MPWDQLLYVCIEISRRQTLSQSCTTSFVVETLLGEDFLEVENGARSRLFGGRGGVLEDAPFELFGRQLRSPSCAFIMLSLNTRHHFLIFPSFMAAQLTFQHHAFALPPVENF